MYELLIAISLIRPPAPCNQDGYDQVYAAIIREALNRPDPCKQILVDYYTRSGNLLFSAPGCEPRGHILGELRNRSIRLLRQICKGQLSSWEKGNK